MGKQGFFEKLLINFFFKCLDKKTVFDSNIIYLTVFCEGFKESVSSIKKFLKITLKILKNY